MAKAASVCVSFFSLFFWLLTLCSSGTELGFSIDARESISASSLSSTLSFLEVNSVSRSRIRVIVSDFRVLRKMSNSDVSVDLYLNENLVRGFIASKSSAILWMKTHVVSSMPHVNVNSITLKGDHYDLSKLLSLLKLISSFQFNDEIKVSVAFSLEFLENLNINRRNGLFRVLGFIRKTKSFVIVEGGFDDYGVNLGKFDDSLMKSKLFSDDFDVNIVMMVKRPFDPTRNGVELGDKLLKSIENSPVSGRIVGFFVEVESVAEKEQKREHEQKFPSFRRELLKSSETVSRDSVTIPPDDNPTPNIVTVPATNPVTITPNVPASTLLPIPSTTPVMVPPTNPFVNPPSPITNPVTTPVPGMQTTYPAPQPGNVPVTNPVAPPATTNPPALPGQSWCVAKTGVTQAGLQSGLDYACGMGGADCSQIQQGGSCYNPDTLLNHASFAFNSYYQKNPVATSCDFGGAASLVSSNPSTGSCIFPLSSSSSSSTTSPSPPSTSLPPPTTSTTNPVTTPSTTNPTNPTTTPITTNPTTTPITTNPTTTPVTPFTGDSGNVTPPSVLNSSSPGTDFGFTTPPGLSSSSTSKTVGLQPLFSCIITVAFFFARTMILDM